ncbi:hypothetical protein Ct9H90mP29_17320 [bacterium]|nr:MAG: hypothetical protein Ct9H90mP29_17320 [bacterium]
MALFYLVRVLLLVWYGYHMHTRDGIQLYILLGDKDPKEIFPRPCFSPPFFNVYVYFLNIFFFTQFLCDMVGQVDVGYISGLLFLEKPALWSLVLAYQYFFYQQ